MCLLVRNDHSTSAEVADRLSVHSVCWRLASLLAASFKWTFVLSRSSPKDKSHQSPPHLNVIISSGQIPVEALGCIEDCYSPKVVSQGSAVAQPWLGCMIHWPPLWLPISADSLQLVDQYKQYNICWPLGTACGSGLLFDIGFSVLVRSPNYRRCKRHISEGLVLSDNLDPDYPSVRCNIQIRMVAVRAHLLLQPWTDGALVLLLTESSCRLGLTPLPNQRLYPSEDRVAGWCERNRRADRLFKDHLK